MRETLYALLLALVPPAQAGGHLHPESYYQRLWCDEHDGMAEVRLADGTRADCLTMEHAVEVDFAAKWAEAIGQAQHYARLTGLQPGILLILERPEDGVYLERLQDTAARVCPYTRIWTITPDG